VARTRAQQKGDRAEGRARGHLEDAGHAVVAANYHCRGGELDLVTLDGETLVFVEVRARANAEHGRPEATVDWRKRKRLLLAARHFLGRHPEHGRRLIRFDVVAVTGEAIHWIRDAFRPDETGHWH
jgi:putative endonuclease